MQTLLKTLYTATADATGGRNGGVKNGDGVIDVKLTVPKGMGGTGVAGTTTPEDLFAAGYAACFGSACEHVARLKKLDVKRVDVHAEVSIGAIAPAGFGLAVKLTPTLHGVDEETAKQVVTAAHEVCPYSNATRGNIAVEIDVKVAP